MTATELVDEVVEEVRTLDEAVTRWEANDREAADTALTAVSLLIVKLHRVHDALVVEVRRYDHQHRPHDRG
jgi:hypothetical protein